jgi:hypothetical protein
MQTIPLCFNLIIIRTSNIREQFGAETIALQPPKHILPRFNGARTSTTVDDVPPRSPPRSPADMKMDLDEVKVPGFA